MFFVYKIKTREGLIFEVNDINSNMGGLSFYEDESGNKYVVGADAVPKKLGSMANLTDFMDNYEDPVIKNYTKDQTATFNAEPGAIVVYLGVAVAEPQIESGLNMIKRLGGYGIGNIEFRIYTATESTQKIGNLSTNNNNGYVVLYANPK